MHFKAPQWETNKVLEDVFVMTKSEFGDWPLLV